MALLGWCVAAALCLSVVYGPYKAQTLKIHVSFDISSFYNSTFRVVWSIGLCWVIFACCTGYGGNVIHTHYTFTI